MSGSCEFKIKKGLFSSENCPATTNYRCPNCGKHICEAHGTYFTWKYRGYQITGFTCGSQCSYGLFANVGFTKGTFDDQSKWNALNQWGGMNCGYCDYKQGEIMMDGEVLSPQLFQKYSPYRKVPAAFHGKV